MTVIESGPSALTQIPKCRIVAQFRLETRSQNGDFLRCTVAVHGALVDFEHYINVVNQIQPPRTGEMPLCHLKFPPDCRLLYAEVLPSLHFWVRLEHTGVCVVANIVNQVGYHLR